MSDQVGPFPSAALVKGGGCRLVLAGMLTSTTWLYAEDSLKFGLQAGLLLPTVPDLRLTTGSGLNGSLGARIEWRSDEGWGSRESQTFRLRVDLERFRPGQQVKVGAGLSQTITTKVRNESLGVEELFYRDRWSLGAGIYSIRWTVASTNRLEMAGESIASSGTSSWTRVGLGLIGGFRWTKHAEVELRFVASHYGQEDQPTGVASLNFVWTF